MANQIDKAIDILISQYPKLKFTQKNMKNITEQIFKMPVPVLPHKRGDIILSAHGELHKSEPYPVSYTHLASAFLYPAHHRRRKYHRPYY